MQFRLDIWTNIQTINKRGHDLGVDPSMGAREGFQRLVGFGDTFVAQKFDGFCNNGPICLEVVSEFFFVQNQFASPSVAFQAIAAWLIGIQIAQDGAVVKSR